LLNIFEKLISLQNFDLTILSLKKKISQKNEDINKIVQQMEFEKFEWENYRKTYEKERIELSHQELELKDTEEKLKKSQNRLYSGDIQSGKELTQWKSSMDAYEKTKSLLEDQIIAQIEKIESMPIKEKEKELHMRFQTYEKSIDKFKLEIQKFEADLNQFIQNRALQVQEIPLDVYSLYEELRKKYPNPVVEMNGDTCQGCHLTLPSSLAKTVRKNENLTQCPNCYRLIFSK